MGMEEQHRQDGDGAQPVNVAAIATRPDHAAFLWCRPMHGAVLARKPCDLLYHFAVVDSGMANDMIQCIS